VPDSFVHPKQETDVPSTNRRSAKSSPIRRSGDATRARILDAAAKVFSEKGYAGARLADIADLAGLQAGSMYYHFDSREALVEEVLRVGQERTTEFVRSRLAALPPDVSHRERLRAAIAAHLLSVLEVGEYTSASIRIFGQLPYDIRCRHLAEQRAYGGDWKALLAAAQAAGEIRADLDLSALRMLILGALNYSVEWYRTGGHLTAELLADEFATVFLEGMAGSPPARAPSSGARPGSRRRQ
jgi:AcrR family transcriptional regulator